MIKYPFAIFKAPYLHLNLHFKMVAVDLNQIIDWQAPELKFIRHHLALDRRTN